MKGDFCLLPRHHVFRMFKKCPQGNRHSGRPAKGMTPAFPSDATTIEAMTVAAETSEDYQEHPGHRKNAPQKTKCIGFCGRGLLFAHTGGCLFSKKGGGNNGSKMEKFWASDSEK